MKHSTITAAHVRTHKAEASWASIRGWDESRKENEEKIASALRVKLDRLGERAWLEECEREMGWGRTAAYRHLNPALMEANRDDSHSYYRNVESGAGGGLVHESPVGETDEWFTPPEIFTALDLVFDLDPCGASPPDKDFVPARRRFTLNDNGLEKTWKGLVWMNPPYGRQTAAWLKKFVQHGNGVGLVFARTDTGWFAGTAQASPLLCFVRHRIRFRRSDGTVAGHPGAGSLLIGLGDVAEAALKKSRLGTLVRACSPHYREDADPFAPESEP